MSDLILPSCYGDGPDEDDCPVSCLYCEDCRDEHWARMEEDDWGDDDTQEPVHRCECGSEDGITEMAGCIPIMSWCAKCGKAYDPWNGFARVPSQDRTPSGGERHG